MKTFTFDHNIIIDLEEKRQPNYQKLVEFLNSQFEQVAITAVSASENPPIKNFSQFKKKIQAISELSKIQVEQILKPMGVYGFSFYDWCLFGDKSMEKLKKDITEALFLNFSVAEGLNKKVRNKLADIMTFWCHVYHKRDIFVTSDQNFVNNNPKLKKIAFYYHGLEIRIVNPNQIMNTL